MKIKSFSLLFFLISCLVSCKKNGNDPAPIIPPAATSFAFNALKVNGAFNGYTYYGINTSPVIKFSFLAPVNRGTVSSSLSSLEK